MVKRGWSDLTNNSVTHDKMKMETRNSNTLQNTKPTENYGNKPESLW